MSDTLLDARGLKCPLPVLRAGKAMQGLPSGGVLQVIATDPGSVSDFQAFCEATGHTLVEQTQHDGEFSFRVKKT